MSMRCSGWGLAEAGKVYRIDLKGIYHSAGTLFDSYLRGVHDANSNLLAGTTDDDGGFNTAALPVQSSVPAL